MFRKASFSVTWLAARRHRPVRPLAEPSSRTATSRPDERRAPVRAGRGSSLGGFAPLRLAGAWKVAVDDPRFGGVSALAVDRGELLALTDSGTVIRFRAPGAVGRGLRSRSCRTGPGRPVQAQPRQRRLWRAIPPAAAGGWRSRIGTQLWLYDRDFRRCARAHRSRPDRWRANNAASKAMVADGDDLLLFPESGQCESAADRRREPRELPIANAARQHRRCRRVCRTAGCCW